MTQTCTDADAHNDTELSIQLPSYYSRASRIHTQTGPVRTHACVRTYFFCPATKVLHKSNYRCFHDDLNHFLMQPLDAVVREEISFLNHLRFCLFIMDSSWCFSSLPLSLPSLFISEEIIRDWAKTRKKQQLVNYKKRDIGKGSARGEERQCFFKVCGFWLFSWPIEPHCALSPQTLRISNGCFLTQSKQIA